MFCAGTVLSHNSFIASRQGKGRLLINLSPPHPGRLLTAKPPWTGSEIGPDFDFDTKKNWQKCQNEGEFLYFILQENIMLSSQVLGSITRWTGGFSQQVNLEQARLCSLLSAEDGLRGGKKMPGQHNER